MKTTTWRQFYDVTLDINQIDHGAFTEALDYVKEFCGAFVWMECETTEQRMPANAKYIDTFYNINVYYDFVTESFLFEDFN